MSGQRKSENGGGKKRENGRGRAVGSEEVRGREEEEKRR